MEIYKWQFSRSAHLPRSLEEILLKRHPRAYFGNPTPPIPKSPTRRWDSPIISIQHLNTSRITIRRLLSNLRPHFPWRTSTRAMIMFWAQNRQAKFKKVRDGVWFVQVVSINQDCCWCSTRIQYWNPSTSDQTSKWRWNWRGVRQTNFTSLEKQKWPTTHTTVKKVPIIDLSLTLKGPRGKDCKTIESRRLDGHKPIECTSFRNNVHRHLSKTDFWEFIDSLWGGNEAGRESTWWITDRLKHSLIETGGEQS